MQRLGVHRGRWEQAGGRNNVDSSGHKHGSQASGPADTAETRLNGPTLAPVPRKRHARSGAGVDALAACTAVARSEREESTHEVSDKPRE